MSFSLNLGAGPQANHDIGAWINADKCLMPNTDVVFDAAEPFPFHDETFDQVKCHAMLMYLPSTKMVHVMNEIWRVLRFGAHVDIRVPCAPYAEAFATPGVQSYWNLLTFQYFIRGVFRCEFDRNFNGFIGGFISHRLELDPLHHVIVDFEKN